MLRAQGHIFGAAAVTLQHGGMRVTFSGDIGRPHDPVALPPQPPADSDWIVCESTYGDRRHLPGSLRAELKPILAEVLARGGTAVIPAFAVGRAQALLHVIADMVEDGDLPPVPLYLNSPMAARVTALYRDHMGEHRLDAAALDRMDTRVRTVSQRGGVQGTQHAQGREGDRVGQRHADRRARAAPPAGVCAAMFATRSCCAATRPAARAARRWPGASAASACTAWT